MELAVIMAKMQEEVTIEEKKVVVLLVALAET